MFFFASSEFHNVHKGGLKTRSLTAPNAYKIIMRSIEYNFYNSRNFFFLHNGIRLNASCQPK